MPSSLPWILLLAALVSFAALLLVALVARRRGRQRTVVLPSSPRSWPLPPVSQSLLMPILAYQALDGDLRDFYLRSLHLELYGDGGGPGTARIMRRYRRAVIAAQMQRWESHGADTCTWLGACLASLEEACAEEVGERQEEVEALVRALREACGGAQK